MDAATAASVKSAPAEISPLGAAGKKALIVFGVALVILVPLTGIKTETINGELVIINNVPTAIILALVTASLPLLYELRATPPVRAIRDHSRVLTGIFLVLLWLAGGVLYMVPGARDEVIGAANDVREWIGGVTGLAAFAAIACFIIGSVVLVIRLLRLGAGASGKVGFASLRAGTNRDLPVALLIVAVCVPVLSVGANQPYVVGTATQILIYVMLGWGLNVVVGLAGLLDLGYVAFYAVGAYTYALLATSAGWSFWVCIPLAGFFAALWGIMLGFPVLRLRGDYLAIVTLAFGEIIRIILLNWKSLTGGPDGINLIPRPSFFGLSFDRFAENSFHNYFGLEFNPSYRVIFLYYIILVLALVTNFVTLRLRRLPIGRAWEALREDEIACRSLGINTTITKLSAFAIGAMFAGIAGSFFATRQGFISPESFSFQESALVLAIVVLGGLGSQLGVVLAAVVLLGASEKLRELQDYRMLIFGLSMVLIMIWRPRGLLASRAPSAVLHEQRNISATFVKEGRG